MKTAGNRDLIIQVVFLFAILLVAINSGCSGAPAIIPEELRGIYKTTHRKYEEQFFELDSRLITFSFRGGMHKHYSIKKIKKEIIDNQTLYTILCANEVNEEEFNFAFFVDFMGEVILYFKNKPKVAWKKQVGVVHYNDNIV
jgi:hypothetical protein